MATPCRIPQENTIYDNILTALNEFRFHDAIRLYYHLSPHEQIYFANTYPEIYRNLCNAYRKLLS